MAIYIEPVRDIVDHLDPTPYKVFYYFALGYHSILFKCGTQAHRTNGPARIKWNDTETLNEYFLRGESVTEEEYMEVYKAPVEDLPLWINDPIRKDIAIDRLAGDEFMIVHLKGPELIKHIAKACNIEPELFVRFNRKGLTADGSS